MDDTPEQAGNNDQAQPWTARVGETLRTAEQFTADEVKAIATDAIEEELNKLPLSRLRAGPQPLSYAERVTPRKRLEQLLAKVSVECLKHFLGEEQPER